MYYQFMQSFPMLEVFIQQLSNFIKILTGFRSDYTFWLWGFFFPFHTSVLLSLLLLKMCPFVSTFYLLIFFHDSNKKHPWYRGSKQGYEQILHDINPQLGFFLHTCPKLISSICKSYTTSIF